MVTIVRTPPCPCLICPTIPERFDSFALQAVEAAEALAEKAAPGLRAVP